MAGPRAARRRSPEVYSDSRREGVSSVRPAFAHETRRPLSLGWNFAVGKGGALAALTACRLAGILYTCVAMIDSEVTSTVAAAGGGEYAQAKQVKPGPMTAAVLAGPPPFDLFL